MCIRDSGSCYPFIHGLLRLFYGHDIYFISSGFVLIVSFACLLYTSDAADERSSVDLGGRRIIKKKNNYNPRVHVLHSRKHWINSDLSKRHAMKCDI